MMIEENLCRRFRLKYQEAEGCGFEFSSVAVLSWNSFLGMGMLFSCLVQVTSLPPSQDGKDVVAEVAGDLGLDVMEADEFAA